MIFRTWDVVGEGVWSCLAEELVTGGLTNTPVSTVSRSMAAVWREGPESVADPAVALPCDFRGQAPSYLSPHLLSSLWFYTNAKPSIKV